MHGTVSWSPGYHSAAVCMRRPLGDMVASLVLSLFGVNTWLLFVSPQQNTLIPAPVVSMPPNAVRRAASQQATVPGRGGAMGHCPTEIAARTAGCTEAEGVFATGFCLG